jgi:hypothetical protein
MTGERRLRMTGQALRPTRNPVSEYDKGFSQRIREALTRSSQNCDAAPTQIGLD